MKQIQTFIQNAIANWKTTSAGLAMIATGASGFKTAWQTKDTDGMVRCSGLVLGGAGLIFAGDSGTSAADIKALHDKIDEITTKIQTGGK